MLLWLLLCVPSIVRGRVIGTIMTQQSCLSSDCANVGGSTTTQTAIGIVDIQNQTLGVAYGQQYLYVNRQETTPIYIVINGNNLTIIQVGIYDVLVSGARRWRLGWAGTLCRSVGCLSAVFNTPLSTIGRGQTSSTHTSLTQTTVPHTSVTDTTVTATTTSTTTSTQTTTTITHTSITSTTITSTTTTTSSRTVTSMMETPTITTAGIMTTGTFTHSPVGVGLIVDSQKTDSGNLAIVTGSVFGVVLVIVLLLMLRHFCCTRREVPKDVICIDYPPDNLNFRVGEPVYASIQPDTIRDNADYLTPEPCLLYDPNTIHTATEIICATPVYDIATPENTYESAS